MIRNHSQSLRDAAKVLDDQTTILQQRWGEFKAVSGAGSAAHNAKFQSNYDSVFPGYLENLHRTIYNLELLAQKLHKGADMWAQTETNNAGGFTPGGP
ncbi:MAG: hypothetical protein ACR2GX_02670 [Candidatus Dormibacteria bacterium]